MSKKTVLAAVSTLLLLGVALCATANVWVHTSCGKVVMTISDPSTSGTDYMTEEEYDQFLRDVNESVCGTRERPNIEEAK